MKSTLVIALGGNALLQRGEILSAENQYNNIALVAEVVAIPTGKVAWIGALKDAPAILAGNKGTRVHL